MLLLSIALNSEARPIIDHFRMKLYEEGPFSVYECETMRLVVTGIKKIFMAAGTSYLAAKYPNFIGFFNLGIAGHKTREVGDFVLAHKIIDPTLGKSFYPHINMDKDSGVVCSIDKMQEGYPKDFFYDMEASSFYSTALRFTTCERIQVAKVVSDNETSPFTNLSKKDVEELVRKRIKDIEEVINTMLSLPKIEKGVDIAPYVHHAHFTHFQKNRLQELLSHLRDLQIEIDPSQMMKFKRAKHILEDLEKQIDGHNLR